MKSIRNIACLAALMSVAVMPAWSQFHGGQEKLLAKQAAIRDAQRNLLESVKGLHIDSQTTVRDFVTQSDQINTAMMESLRGAAIVPGSETWDGEIYRLEMQVTLEQVRAAIEQIQRTYPSGRTYITENMTTINKEVVVKAPGQGSTRAANMPGAGAPPPPPAYGGTAAIVPRQVPPGWENVTPQGRLLAERAARVDAYRKLGERIKGLKVAANTTVRDFVTQADVINTQFEAHLKGARQVGPTRFLPDQTCEIDMEVTIQDVIKWLQEVQDWVIHPDAHHLDHPIRTMQFEHITDFGPERVIRETGAGAPRADTIRGEMPPQMGAPAAAVQPPPQAMGMPAWAAGAVSAKGSGVPRAGDTGTAAKLNAERAAELDARRNLLEKVQGVQIDSQTSVKDFMTQNDQVRARVQSVLQGADISDPKYLEDGSVEVVASLPLEKVYRAMQPGQ